MLLNVEAGMRRLGCESRGMVRSRRLLGNRRRRGRAMVSLCRCGLASRSSRVVGCNGCDCAHLPLATFGERGARSLKHLGTIMGPSVVDHTGSVTGAHTFGTARIIFTATSWRFRISNAFTTLPNVPWPRSCSRLYRSPSLLFSLTR